MYAISGTSVPLTRSNTFKKNCVSGWKETEPPGILWIRAPISILFQNLDLEGFVRGADPKSPRKFLRNATRFQTVVFPGVVLCAPPQLALLPRISLQREDSMHEMIYLQQMDQTASHEHLDHSWSSAVARAKPVTRLGANPLQFSRRLWKLERLIVVGEELLILKIYNWLSILFWRLLTNKKPYV